MMPNVENVHSPRNRSVSLTAEITSTTVEALENSLFAGPWADLNSGINIGVFEKFYQRKCEEAIGFAFNFIQTNDFQSAKLTLHLLLEFESCSLSTTMMAQDCTRGLRNALEVVDEQEASFHQYLAR